MASGEAKKLSDPRGEAIKKVFTSESGGPTFRGLPICWVLYSAGTAVFLLPEHKDQLRADRIAEANKILDAHKKIKPGTPTADFNVLEQMQPKHEGIFTVIYPTTNSQIITVVLAKPTAKSEFGTKAAWDRMFKMGVAAREARKKDTKEKNIIATSED